MKRFLIFGLTALFFVAGCKKDKEEPTYEPTVSNLIVGKWVTTQKNGTPVLTDEKTVMHFSNDSKLIYSKGIITDANNKRWVENDQLTYSVSDKTITIDGTELSGSALHLELTVISISQTELVYKTQEGSSYTCQHISESFSTAILGIWKGHETTNGLNPEHDTYWEYLSNGNYNYYYYDEETAQYILKEDNNGQYFLYGNLLATNYTNDILLEEDGTLYECWNIAVEGNQMDWSGLRADGITRTFSMQRVENPPTINYSAMLLGEWVNTHINNEPIITDNAFVLHFYNTMIEMYATGYQLDENNKQWKESSAFVYAVNNNIVTVNGSNAVFQSTELEMNILNISENTLTYSVNLLKIDNEVIADNKIYTLKKVNVDLSNTILGVWKGRETTSGTTQEHDWYWTFYNNGKYDYYWYDEELGTYELRDDGEYLMYGDFLVSNYDTHINAPYSNLIFDCWNIVIEGNNMVWERLRADNSIQSFSMERTDAPPMK